MPAQAFLQNDILNWQDSEQYKVWEAGDEEQGYYRITTFHIEWRGQNAYAHIVVDITDEKQAANRLNSKAYMDRAPASITGCFLMNIWKACWRRAGK